MLGLLIEDILNETANVNDINDAIDNHKRIIINYQSKGEDVANGARVIEVYAYGLTKAGNPVIRAFQPYGDTTSRVPAWKFFRLDRIKQWKETKQTYSHPASFYYKGLGEFNPNDDLTMSTVYKIADFNGNNTKTSTSAPKTKDEVFKTDTERGMERLKQQLNNPITLSDLKTQNGFKDVNINKTNDSGPKTQTDANINKENELSDLRNKLGDTTNPIQLSDLKKRLSLDNEDEVFKTDTERGMERLKQQLNNPQKIDLSQIPKR